MERHRDRRATIARKFGDGHCKAGESNLPLEALISPISNQGMFGPSGPFIEEAQYGSYGFRLIDRRHVSF